MNNPTKTFLRALPNLIMLALVLGGLYVVFRYFDTETIKQFVESAGIWAPLALITAKASTIVFAPIGGTPLYPLAGALFGFWGGFTYLIIGDALGGIISFYISRIWGRKVVSYFFPDNKLLDRVLRVLGSVKGLLVARVAFISFPELISYAAGLTRIPFWQFFVIFISVSVIPVAALVGLGTLFTVQNSPWSVTGFLVASVVVFGTGMYLFSRYVKEQNPELKNIDVE